MGKAKKSLDDFTREQKQQAIDNYLFKKQGLNSAGKEFGISQYWMEKILKEMGIPKRTYVEAKQQMRVYSCNDDFFKIQTPNMAYILGLLAADGNIAQKENKITIELLRTDKEVLEKIKKVTESSREIKDYTKTSTGQEISKFEVWSHEWKQDLAKYNIVPNKTFILEPPLFLRKELYIHYIRGYFDGDGTIWHNEYSCYFGIVGASKPVIEWIRQVLATQFGIITNKINIEHKKDYNQSYIYKVQYGGRENMNRLYNALYSLDAEIFLNRKKEKFYTLLQNFPRDSNTSV